jgi:predicted ArsR family transcriptional regulator
LLYERAIAISKRHRDLLALVRSGSYSASGLALKLGVSEATVNRDILFLRTQGHRIESVRLLSAWAYRFEAKERCAPMRRRAGAR